LLRPFTFFERGDDIWRARIHAAETPFWLRRQDPAAQIGKVLSRPRKHFFPHLSSITVRSWPPGFIALHPLGLPHFTGDRGRPRLFFPFGDFRLRRGDLQGVSFFFEVFFGDRSSFRRSAAFLLTSLYVAPPTSITRSVLGLHTYFLGILS